MGLRLNSFFERIIHSFEREKRNSSPFFPPYRSNKPTPKMSSSKGKEAASNTMEAIRKKMQQMKKEKEESVDRAEQAEERMKELQGNLKERDDKINSLNKKIQQVENDLDTTTENLSTANTNLESANKQVQESEAEVSALQRRCQLVEEDLERSEERLGIASEKLEEASKAADESERSDEEDYLRPPQRDKSCLTNSLEEIEIPMEAMPQQSTAKCDSRLDPIKEETPVDSKSIRGLLLYPLILEASRRNAMLEVDLERAEQRGDDAEAKIQELEEELKVVGNNMKSLEVSEAEALAREESYEETLRDLSLRFKDAEARAAEGERQTGKLQKETDKLEADLNAQMELYKLICQELEQAFNELSGY